MNLVGMVNGAARMAAARARAFFRARRGNVAIIVSLTLIPVMIAGGASIDLSRTLAARTALMAALDAAALAVATSNPSTLTHDQQVTIAQNYFNANYRLNSSFGTPAPVTVTVTDNSAVVTTTTAVPTTLMRIALIDSVPLTTSSTATWGQTKLWVSLVLDNTGSMSDDGKMAALKTATHQLLDLLESASAHPGDVQVSLVPFVKDVNAGASNYGASWIDWTEWEAANPNYGTCSNTAYTTKTSCLGAGSCSVSGRTSQSSCGTCNIGNYTSEHSCESHGGCTNPDQSHGQCGSSKGCSISGYSSKNSCQNHGGVWNYGSWISSGTWTPATWTPGNYTWTPDHSRWNGCVMDRGNSSGPDTTNNYDTMNTAPGSDAASKFPAEQYSDCPQQLTPLGYDWSALSDEVDAMTPNGNTNQTIGLAWGWHSLTDGDPLNPGAIPANTTPIIILMSDGLNTENRWSGSQSTIDTRMSDACDNFKNWAYDSAHPDARPVIYTVQVDTGGDGVSSVLQNCATGGASGGKYYHLTAAGDTITAFNQIGQEITNMRVSH